MSDDGDLIGFCSDQAYDKKCEALTAQWAVTWLRHEAIRLGHRRDGGSKRKSAAIAEAATNLEAAIRSAYGEGG